MSPCTANRISPYAALRQGITTGLCAAAAAKAATLMLFSAQVVSKIDIQAKTNEVFQLDVLKTTWFEDTVTCAIKKDAGDDPDATNGLLVFATVCLKDTSGIEIDGGEGVGRVTKPGLKVPVGMAAINPVPREMISSAIAEVCEHYGYHGGVLAIISIPGGEDVAEKTMNARLGIKGGLSILGTTGIVRPMSTRALLETIKTEIDVQVAAGRDSLLVTPGNYGEEFATRILGLKAEQVINCSNFLGDTLDHACAKGIQHVLLVGHVGKMVKLAGGIMNTHSHNADCRREILAAHCAMAGADQQAIQEIMDCTTTTSAISIIDGLGIGEEVWASIEKKICFYLNQRTQGLQSVEFVVFTGKDRVLMHAQTGQKGGDVTYGTIPS